MTQLSPDARRANQPSFKGQRVKVIFRLPLAIADKIKVAASLTGDTVNEWAQANLDKSATDAINADGARAKARQAERQAARRAALAQTDIEDAIKTPASITRLASRRSAKTDR